MEHDDGVKTVAGAGGLPWWRRPYRMVQTNLRLIDASLDPKRLAKQVRDFGADVLVFNVGGIYAFYPTKLEFQQKNPFLKTDLLGEMIEAAHAEGLVIVGRMDVSKSTHHTYAAHPEWFVHNAKGQPIEYNGTYQACVNGAWYKDYAQRILREALQQYPLDGIFFNMFGYRSSDYSGNYHGICVCENCVNGFKNMFGRALPSSENFSDPAYRDYLKFQEKTTADLYRDMYRTIKEVNLDVAMTGHRHAFDLIRHEVQRAVDRPQPEWPYQSGEQARWGRMISLDQAMYASTATNFVDYPWRYAAETAAYQTLRFAQQLASGAALDYYLLGTFDQPDTRPFEAIRKLYQWHHDNEASYRDLVSGARVGLYHSRKSYVHRGAVQTGKQTQESFRGAYRALIDGRIPFEFVSDEHSEKPEFGSILDKFDVVLLSSITCVSDTEAEALDAYVRRGGKLIATGEVALYDENGVRRNETALASLPVSQIGCDGLSRRGGYFQKATEALEAGHTELLMLDGFYFDVTAKAEARTRLRMIPPQRFGPPELCFSDAAGNEPGIIEAEFGDGKTYYLPWQPELQYYRDSLPDIRSVITNLVSEASPEQPVVLEGKGPVELTIQQGRDGRRTLVHVVNYSGQRKNLFEEPAELHKLKLGVLKGGSARLLVANQSIEPSAKSDGRFWFELPPVGTFEVLEIVDSNPG